MYSRPRKKDIPSARADGMLPGQGAPPWRANWIFAAVNFAVKRPWAEIKSEWIDAAPLSHLNRLCRDRD